MASLLQWTYLVHIFYIQNNCAYLFPCYYLDMFFGGGGRGRRERKGKDVVHQMAVTLEELYNGSVRKLALQKNVVCDSCEGRQIFLLFLLSQQQHKFIVL